MNLEKRVTFDTFMAFSRHKPNVTDKLSRKQLYIVGYQDKFPTDMCPTATCPTDIFPMDTCPNK